MLRTPAFALLLATALLGAFAAVSAPGAEGYVVGPDGHVALGRLLAAGTAAGAVVALLRSYGTLRHAVALRTRAEAEARAAALTDELTGLYNRRGFRALAEHQLRIVRRNGGDVLLLFLDLNRFKPINDRYGHAEGDRALCEMAALLRATVRDTDVVARLGGDEFAVLVVDADDATERAVITRLARALAQRNAVPERRYRLEAAIGAARFDDDRGAELDEMLQRADAALYASKRQQRLQTA
ncbi:GGDEF domain-containing protein [Roseisolibacter agri]|uniref:GGDEF domain-containing protein n=1 Tax=Roseisolibacter agri TaxID=2014610 RepID=UPI0024E0A7CF|nr:GGDEF domain-containing protein [Roseisolibacter agri]